MGFNIGAFGSGLSEGIGQASTLQDQQLSRQLKQQQLQEYMNAQAGQRAFTNVAMPGANAMPGTPENPGSGWPTMAQLPVIGPIAQGIQDAGSSFMDLFGGGQGGQPSGGMMPPVPMRSPMPSAPPSAAPDAAAGGPGLPQAQPAGADHPGLAGTPQIPGMQIVTVVAQAIDKANPGLRQSNPQAFTQAVQMGVKQVTDYASNQAEIGKRNAEISHLGAQTKAEESKVPLNESHAKLFESRAANPGGKSAIDVMNKDINTQITQTGVALRHYENLKSRALSAPVLTPELKAMAAEAQNYINALQVQMSTLKKQQTDYTPPKAAPQEMELPKVSPGKATLLGPIIDQMVKLDSDPVKTTKYHNQLKAGGMPEDEIRYVLMSAKARLANPSGKEQGRLPRPQNQASFPQIPMAQ